MSSFEGKFVWYELMTSDTSAAKAFYSDVVGWSAADNDMAGFTYTVLSADDAMVAGLMEMPEGPANAGASPVWIGYIWADDVDAMAERVKAAGGAIHRPPEDIPGVGRFAVVADPHGAVFCLFRAASSETDDLAAGASPVTPGHAGWRELMAGDLNEAFAFYSGLFGWEKAEAVDMGDMGIYQLFSKDGVTLGGMMTKPPVVPQPYWGYYFTVEDINAAADRVKAGGGTVVNGPMEVPGGAWIVQCTDPQGAFFALTAPPAG